VTDVLAALVHYLADLGVETAAVLGDPAARSAVLARAGLQSPQGAPPSADDITAALDALAQKSATPGQGDDALTLLADLSEAMVALVAFVQQAAGAHNVDDAWNALASLLDVIYVDRLRRQNPEALAALQALHLISNDRLLIADLIRARSRWGSFLLGNPPDDESRADNWSLILGAALAVAGKWIPPEDSTGKRWRQDILFGWDLDPAPVHPHIQRVLQRAATFRLTHRDGAVEESAGLTALVVPPADGGWGMFLALDVGAGLTFPIGDHLELHLEVDVPNALDAFFGEPSFAEASGAGANAKILLRRKQETAEHWNIGSDKGIHLEIGTFTTGFELGSPTRFRLSIGDGALVMPKAGMGFIGSVLPSDGAKLTFDVEMAVDTHGNVAFTGGAGMLVTIPVNESISVLSVRSVTIGLALEDTAQGAGASLSVTASFGVNFGSAFNVAVDQMGAKLVWALPSSPQPGQGGAPVAHGNLGTFGDLSVDFVAPRGIGVQLNIGPVKGGGFLFFDPQRRTYGGVLEAALALCDKGIQIKAAGLLRETDDGWSFVVIVSAQFDPAIEVFLGLTLNGVGGIVGVNVAIDVDKLSAGLHDGSVGRLLFPDDPVANAPAIIATMSNVFPSRMGGWVAGPMLQLGWGRPESFVTLSVAVVLAMPSPALLAILGRLRLVAPTSDFGIIDLKADFLGVINFDEPSVRFDASLVDSRMAAFPLTGDMALRVGDAGFVLAIGGLNPQFTSPIPLPTLKRVAIDISPNPITKIRVEAYVGVTSNTFQVGVHASLDIDAGPASIHGWLDFDALIQWEPRFRFSIHMDIGLELRVEGESVAGVSVDLLFEGPSAWHAKGTASLHIFLFTIHAGFEVTWGEVDGASTPPEVDASAQVADALNAPGAWTAVAPQGDALVTFRSVQRDDIGVHPYGSLSVRQQAVPLGIPVTRIGRSHVIGGTATVSISPIAGAPAAGPTTGLFATSQYQDLSDDDKLSRPSFESFQDGVTFGSAQTLASSEQLTTASYETVFIPDGRRHIGVMDLGLLVHALDRNSVARSNLHRAEINNGPDQRVHVSGPQYRVVNADTLSGVAGVADVFTSYTAARAAAASLGQLGLAVVGAHEVHN
jgi:hypothetical protein